MWFARAAKRVCARSQDSRRAGGKAAALVSPLSRGTGRWAAFTRRREEAPHIPSP
jgi:hypothetical protein